ncbi:MAG TPA: hypothetical protein VK569_05080, partial [Bacteroidota bacterium]|nr:hypothetical protein [Bacteroidota bacterium]
IADAEAINSAFGNNTARSAYGAYAEAAYDMLYTPGTEDESLTAFIRYERLNMNASVPSNGTFDPALDQHHVITGLSYSPIRNVIVKADARFTWTASGEEAPLLNGASEGGGSAATFITLGLGFSF